MREASRHWRGVTLIEVIIALVIVAILATIAVPYMGSYLQTRRVEGAAQALSTAITSARTYASSNQTTTTMVFQSGSSWCFGATTASNCDCNVPSSCNLGQTQSSSYKNVSLALSGLGGGQTQFSSSRGVVSNTGTATFTVSMGAINIVLTGAGSVTLCSNQGLGGLESC